MPPVKTNSEDEERSRRCASGEEIVDAYLDEIEAAYNAEQDAAEEEEIEDLIVQPEPPATPMIAAVLQENLKKALDIVVPYIPSHPPLPVLSHTLLETHDGCRLAISATDLETSITVYIGSKVECDGAITVPAKLFKELVATLSRERVDFRVDAATDTVHMRCGVQTSELRGIDADEYPPIKHNDERCDFMVEAETLLRMLETVLKCAAREQNRPILTGVYMHLDRGRLTLVGADGYRLGVERLDVDYTGPKVDDITMPGGAIKKLLRVLRQHKSSEVGVKLPDERLSVTFYLPNTVISTQLLEGRFPDYASIIPRSFASQVVLYAS